MKHSILDVDLRNAESYIVRFVCRRCKATASRPAVHLVGRYGCVTLRDVQRRARCLVYRGGVRCNGEADVWLEARMVRDPGCYGSRPWTEGEVGV